MFGRREHRQPVGDVAERHAEFDPDGRRCQGIQQVTVSRQADGEAHGAGRRLDFGGGARHAAVLGHRGPHVGAGGQSEGDHASGKAAGVRHHQRVVGVADQQRAGARLLENLGLGLGDGGARPEEPEVSVADIGPHPHVGLGDVDQHADLAGVVHAQFHHRHVGCGPQFDQRDGQSEMVVEVAAVLHHAITRAEDRRDRVLGGGLAGAAGDRHDPRPRRLPHRAGQVLQRAQRIGDFDDDGVARRVRHRAVNDDAGGAAGQRRRHELVTVARGVDGEEELPGRQQARVDGHRAEPPIAGAGRLPAGGGLRQVRRAVGPVLELHHQLTGP